MLTKKGYNKTDTAKQINRAISISRKKLINKIKTSNTDRLPLTVMYTWILPVKFSPDLLIYVVNNSKLVHLSKCL